MDALAIAVAAVEKSYRLWHLPVTDEYRCESLVFWPGYVDSNGKVVSWHAVSDSDFVSVPAR